MSKVNFPAGVEPHGNGVRITFGYGGKRRRVSLKVPLTQTSLNSVAKLRGKAMLDIEMGRFSFRECFPGQPVPAWAPDAEPDQRELLVEDFIDDVWAPTITGAPSTVRAFESKINAVIKPKWGKFALHQIKPSDVKGWVADMSRTKAPKTVNNTLIVARSLFGLAVADELMKPKILDQLTNIPVPRHSQADPYTPEELAILITECPHEWLSNMMDFWWMCGLRPNEIIALQWADVDWTRKMLHIRRGLVEGEVRPLKTNTERFVDIPARAIRLLKRQERLTGQFPTIFAQEDGSTFRDFKPIHERLMRLSAKAGVRVRRGGQFRHTYASLMLSSREAPYFVKEQMGHSTLMMIERHYGKWMRGYEWESFADCIAEVEREIAKLTSSSQKVVNLR